MNFGCPLNEVTFWLFSKKYSENFELKYFDGILFYRIWGFTLHDFKVEMPNKLSILKSNNYNSLPNPHPYTGASPTINDDVDCFLWEHTCKFLLDPEPNGFETRYIRLTSDLTY